MQVYQQFLAIILSGSLAFTPLDGYALSPPAQSQQTQPPPQGQPSPSNQDLPSLVAPIALYPDALVAQILAAATYPTQVVEADRWLQQNKSLTGDALMQAVNQQPWDESVKALTQFPDVLHNMSQNLTWTSALGDAYFNDKETVMDTIQDMRTKAQAAGNLQSNSQQTVSTQGQTIVIQPAQTQVVYVPQYNPTVVYGAPVPMYYGYTPYYPSTGAVVASSIISFGVGVAVGAAISGGWGWGWGAWGCNWHGGTVIYNHNTYISRSNTFVNRNNYYRGGNYRPSYNPGGRPPRPTPYNGGRPPGNNYNRPGTNPGGNYNRPGTNPGGNYNRPGTNPGGNYNRPGNNNPGNNTRPGGNGGGTYNRPGSSGGNNTRPGGNGATNLPAKSPSRGYGQPNTGSRQGAFNGYNSGGAARQQSARGQQSLGASRGGGGFSGHAGGGRRR